MGSAGASIDFKVFKGSKSGEIVECAGHRELGPTQALIDITHCGVCGTDAHYTHVQQGLGHEGVGIITELGYATSYINAELKVGDRVGLGYMQKYCGYCKMCLTGQDMYCLNSQQYGDGSNADQGCFATKVAWDVSALTKIPDEMTSEDAGPMMCGGASVWGPLSYGGLKVGDRVGVLGLGGLGHLAIQMASKMGYEVVVFSTTESKKEEAMKFGATEFHATAGVTKFEGVKGIDHLLITTSVTPDLALYLTVMAKMGKMFPLTVTQDAPPLPLTPLIVNGVSVVGSAGTYRQEFRTMLDFCVRHGVRPQIQKFPMTQKGITEALKTLEAGSMRYRGVLEV